MEFDYVEAVGANIFDHIIPDKLILLLGRLLLNKKIPPAAGLWWYETRGYESMASPLVPGMMSWMQIV
jgi:hypothetical protein